MSSEPIRDPIADRLLTPQNAMLMVIDYQPTQVNSIKSMDHDTLVEHVVIVIRTARFWAPDRPLQRERADGEERTARPTSARRRRE